MTMLGQRKAIKELYILYYSVEFSCQPKFRL